MYEVWVYAIHKNRGWETFDPYEEDGKIWRGEMEEARKLAKKLAEDSVKVRKQTYQVIREVTDVNNS
jgi:hypothetical protein